MSYVVKDKKNNVLYEGPIESAESFRKILKGYRDWETEFCREYTLLHGKWIYGINRDFPYSTRAMLW